MTATLFAVMSGLLASKPVAAQASAAGTIAGTWTGELESDGDRRTPARLVLQVDGTTLTGLITGRQLIPGDVKGTYDPRASALAFTVSLQGTDTRIRFQGGIANDTLTMRATHDGQTFVLRVTRAGDDVAVVPATQPQEPRDPAAAAVRRSFTEVRGWILSAANAMPAERYGYRPAESVRTVGQMLGHIVDGYAYYCGRGAGGEVEWSEATEKGRTDKPALLGKLAQATEACDAAYANPGAIGPLVENVAHASLHYGNLVTYMRMLGLVPPSS